MNTINKIVKDTVPPKIELDRVSYDALWLDVSDEANPTLKVKSGNEYKETNGAASVSLTVTDPQTGEPVTVTGLANILNALVDMVEQGGGDVHPSVIEIVTLDEFSNKTEDEVAEMWGITPAQFRLIYTTPGTFLITDSGKMSYSVYFYTEDTVGNSHEIMLVGVAPNGNIAGRYALICDGGSDLWTLSMF